MTLFGYTLLFLRNRKKLTLSALSEALGIGITTLENIESGYIVPETDLAQKIADYFGVTVGYMKGSVEMEMPPQSGDASDVRTPQRYVRLKPISLQVTENGDVIRCSAETGDVILPLPASDRSDYMAIQITDNSMVRYGAMAGSMLAVRQDPLKIRNGDLVLLLSDEGHTILRRYFRKGNDVLLRSDDDDLLPPIKLSDCDKTCRLIGTVVQIRTDIDADFLNRRSQNPPRLPVEILPPPDMKKQEGTGGIADYMYAYIFDKKEK